jgi:UDP-galactopyranose mutase
MWTFNKLWNITTPKEAEDIIKQQSSEIGEPKNLEEQAIKLVGKDVYELLIKGYTAKQWRKDPKDLPKEIIKRLPVRFTYNNNYYFDRYQGIPIGGYTQIFEKLLNGIETKLNCDFFTDDLPEHDKVIYTGPIDKFFNYKYGHLEYKTVALEHQHLDTNNHQGIAVTNHTKQDVPYTRIIEHKHFEFGQTDTTWVSHEYPIEYIPEKTEPYYPVNDKENNEMYLKYKEEADKLENVYFGGRLAEYKYYDMHQVIESALNFVKTL